jgi:hypothetical protein
MRFSKHFACLLWAAALILAVSCRGSGNSPSSPFREFVFTVDSTRLGSAVSVGPFRLRAPVGWEAADSGLLVQVQEHLAQDTSRLAARPVLLYLNHSTQSVFLGVIFRAGPTADEGFVGWARRFVETTRSANPNATVEEEWLLIGQVRAVQLYTVDSLRVQFKFLLDAPTPVGLDFSVPRPAWEYEVRSIESSLGTLRKS